MRAFYLLSFLLPAVFAQGDYDGGSREPTGDSESGTHVVHVGRGGFVFDPDTVTAAEGEKVEFVFHPTNHSVVEASFDKPCEPAEDHPIYSGFVPVQRGTANRVFTVTIRDTRPTWLYCSQNRDRHCQAGMVMVINPPRQGPNTLDAFREAASRTDRSTSPREISGGVFSSREEDGHHRDGDDDSEDGRDNGGDNDRDDYGENGGYRL